MEEAIAGFIFGVIISFIVVMVFDYPIIWLIKQKFSVIRDEKTIKKESREVIKWRRDYENKLKEAIDGIPEPRARTRA